MTAYDLGAMIVAMGRTGAARAVALALALIAWPAEAQDLPEGLGVVVFDDRVSRFGYVPTRSPSGTPLRWAGGCVFVRPHLAGTTHIDGDREQDIIAGVLDHWQAATRHCGYLRLELEAPEAGEVALDYVNRILFREDRWCRPATGDHAEQCHNPASSALATLIFIDRPGDPNDGVIVDADIEVNAVDFSVGVCDGTTGRCVTEGTPPLVQDLANTLTHEVGHLLGFEHTCWAGSGPAPRDADGVPVLACSSLDLPREAIEATMFNFIDVGETHKATLEPMDIDAFCETYPLGMDPGTCGPAMRLDAGVDGGSPDDGGVDASASPDGASAPDAGGQTDVGSQLEDASRRGSGTSAGGCTVGQTREAPSRMIAPVIVLAATLIQRRARQRRSIKRVR